MPFRPPITGQPAYPVAQPLGAGSPPPVGMPPMGGQVPMQGLPPGGIMQDPNVQNFLRRRLMGAPNGMPMGPQY